MNYIIGLMGYARVGKDTVAKLLPHPVYHLADNLKADVDPLARKLGLDPVRDKERVRPLYVAYGMAARSTDPAYWIKRLSKQIGDSPHAGPVVVADVRYLNEYLWVRSRGGLVIHLERFGVDAANDEEYQSIGEVLAYVTAYDGFLPKVVNPADAPQDAADFIQELVNENAPKA